jgi:hypothetical protein
MQPNNTNQGQQFAPGQYQTPSYRDIGFNPFLERQPSTYIANDQLQSYISPFIAQADESGFLFSPFTDTSQLAQIQQQPTDASNLTGTIASQNGNLQIDLTTGEIAFSDGALTSLNVGGAGTDGTTNSITATDSQGNTILSSVPSS